MENVHVLKFNYSEELGDSHQSFTLYSKFILVYYFHPDKLRNPNHLFRHSFSILSVPGTKWVTGNCDEKWGEGGKGGAIIDVLGEDKRQFVASEESCVSPSPPPSFLTMGKTHLWNTYEDRGNWARCFLSLSSSKMLYDLGKFGN